MFWMLAAFSWSQLYFQEKPEGSLIKIFKVFNRLLNCMEYGNIIQPELCGFVLAGTSPNLIVSPPCAVQIVSYLLVQCLICRGWGLIISPGFN